MYYSYLITANYQRHLDTNWTYFRCETVKSTFEPEDKIQIQFCILTVEVRVPVLVYKIKQCVNYYNIRCYHKRLENCRAKTKDI